ncbi:MAG: DNA adenine methylase [Clostridiales Family XIII bacterium]|jgi:DNA adenine methylase|nr:DNA adenine methylase [Clostridiales Family XIII bacterium]
MGVGQNIRPFVKWAGGKGQLLGEIRALYPEGLGTRYTKYAEPFVGGGAVLFDVLDRFEVESVYACDVNRELICAYSAIKNAVEPLISALTVLQKEYLSLDAEARAQYFYEKRRLFNEAKNKLTADADAYDAVECAALFVFLNKTCYNGLYRVNRSGAYNVPPGAYAHPSICDETNLRAISEKLRKVTIACGDYRTSSDFIDDRTFVYVDPPYRPLTKTANFTAYTESGFDDAAQRELAAYVAMLARRGAKVVVSNSDPGSVDAQDRFFELLYSGFRIERAYATRRINSNAKERSPISELLISN